MKVSEITQKDICCQIRTEEEYLNDDDKKYLDALKKAAIEYVKSYTGLTEKEIDTHEDISIAVLVVISDMYDWSTVNSLDTICNDIFTETSNQAC